MVACARNLNPRKLWTVYPVSKMTRCCTWKVRFDESLGKFLGTGVHEGILAFGYPRRITLEEPILAIIIFIYLLFFFGLFFLSYRRLGTEEEDERAIDEEKEHDLSP